MRPRVDFYFDVACPYAYLAHTQIEAICARHGADLAWKPILLGGLFRSVRGDDGPMPTMAPERAAMNLRDMHRWAEAWGVPLVMPAGHPRRTVLAMRAILAARDPVAAAKALFRAYWVDGRDVTQPDEVRAALDATGPDGAAAVKKTGEQAIKDELQVRTDEAAAAGAFGVPTFVIHRDGREPELHWGQDRLDFVEDALRGGERELEIWFDYSSPYAYLGATQAARVAAAKGARLQWRPFLLGGLFKAIGTADVPLLAMPAAKQRWVAAELERWSRRWGVPYRFASRFPMNTVAALRVTLIVPPEDRARLVLPLFRALWLDDRDLADKAELARIVDGAGFDGAALVGKCDDPAIKQALRDATDEARAIGVCGAPCFRVRTQGDLQGTLFWGQDRLALVERALDGWRPRAG